uniref:hypothetical protein n=1 Tax=uncultured Draconibacterium sp. TaxID=1573823 RepID=UPI0032164D83
MFTKSLIKWLSITGVSIIGYKPAWLESFEIDTFEDHHHKKPIFVEFDSYQPEDVNGIEKKPLYEMKIDRMLVNAEKE